MAKAKNPKDESVEASAKREVRISTAFSEDHERGNHCGDDLQRIIIISCSETGFLLSRKRHIRSVSSAFGSQGGMAQELVLSQLILTFRLP